jgi:hypothetical protein
MVGPIRYTATRGGKAMKCPLQPLEVRQGKDRVIIVGTDCIQQECAWWVEGADKCVIPVIAYAVVSVYGEGRKIEAYLKKINSKIPLGIIK